MTDQAQITDRLRAANWSGSIPVLLSLAPTSLSSPTLPPPIHVLVCRHTFLHVGLQDAVLRLHKFAPPTLSFAKRVVEEPDTTDDMMDRGEATQDSKERGDSDGINGNSVKREKPEAYPVCWFEDVETELPLRWQLFAGILWDSHTQLQSASTDKNGGSPSSLPWKIRLHFTNYPSSQLLDLDSTSTGGVLTTVERTFKNSLKQALVLQHGQNKVALNMTKQSHQRLWDSIVTAKYSIYKPIQRDIQADSSRVTMIPIRVLEGSTKPMIQKCCTTEHNWTLGELLKSWLPNLFQESDSGTVQPTSVDIAWRVAGVVPPLSEVVVDLWQNLCHPDCFLYISIVTQ